ncbi:MAG: nucleotide pyrophosphohydrolase [Gemmatimonadota bacterium]|nr:nucleotide pyrophosphohydrolase [Gemmatimonadota bacterium]
MSDLKTLQAEILRFRDERDWAQFHTPKNLAMALGIEVGELQELMLWKTDGDVAALLTEPARRKAVSHEIADIMIYALLFAAATGIDPAHAIRDKLQHNSDKYPVAQSRGSANKYTELNAAGEAT